MKKSVVILLNLGYWMMYVLVLFLMIVFLSFPQLTKGVTLPFFQIFIFLFSFAILPGIISFYSFYSILFSRFLYRRKILKLVFSGIIVSAICGIIGGVVMTILGWFKMGPSLYNDGANSAFALTLIMAFNALANGIVGLVIKGFITSYGDIKLKEDLNKKNHEIELELIRSQINPHFLFNTINNIDVLIEKDPVKASAYLNKLSDIMRFMLYETKTEKIELSKELTYIEKYIDLQKIRTSNVSYVNYSVEGDPGNLMIAPMLFIPFIENAFKYAENKKIENAIKIRIVIEKNKIIFECENYYSNESQAKPEQSGLGNELIKKRLDLLYSKNHSLEIENKNNVYNVKLILNS